MSYFDVYCYHDHSWTISNDIQALTSITSYFGIELLKLSHDDWDETEMVVQRVIKSSRAGTNLKA